VRASEPRPSRVILELRARRRELELTQSDVALALHVSRAAVGHWELGMSDPSLGRTLSYAHLLGSDLAVVLLAELIADSGTP
jgi:DNA-binding XRE family transcriptional regulator